MLRMRIYRLWIAALASAMPCASAWAVPFVVELTVPEVGGYVFLSGQGAPGTRFTAPHVVLRASGDTANTGGFGYQATVRIEIPGIGNGVTLVPDATVFVDSDSVEITSPSFPTMFNMGVRASFPAIPGYALQASIGPIALNDTFTYHWGPTSAMIPFTLDNGVTGTIAGGSHQGGLLKITAGGSAPNPIAARVYNDLDKFLAATGPNRVATFEEGSGDASAAITFPDKVLSVVESVTEASSSAAKPHAYWFGATGSPSRFALVVPGSPTPPTNGLEAVFPEAILAAGLVFNCYECTEGSTPVQYGMLWTTSDADGTTIERGAIVFDRKIPAGSLQPGPSFLGLTTTKPFRRLTVQRTGPFGGLQRWMIDDLRYATTLPAFEYHHAGFDHYFVTSMADELTKLDDATFAGWKRTGLQFNVGAPGAAGTRPVCRLFSTAFGPKSSHFYSSDPAECELRKADPHWQFEGTVFSLMLPDASGHCASGSLPLFRLYNNGQGGAPNHRYTTSAVARQAMIDAGWISEGAGALGEIGCVLQ